MRRLPLAVLLVACCALPLTPACGDEEPRRQPSPDAGSEADAGTDGGTSGTDGGPPDAGSGDTLAPTVESSTPTEGTLGLYPVEVYYRTTGQAGLSERKVLTVRFSEPMDTSLTQATLYDLTDPSNEPRPVGGTWSADGQTLTLTVLQPEEGGSALNADTAYAVDLKGFRDIAGNALDAAHVGLGDGRLDFRTGPVDRLLNHACGHTLVDSLTTVSAAATSTGTVPRMDQTHKHYEVSLPDSGGAFTGYTRMLLETETDHVLFLGQDVEVALHDVLGDMAVEAAKEPVPLACAGLTHRVRFTSPLDPEVRARFTGPKATFRAILEQDF